MHTAKEMRELARIVSAEYAGDTLPVTEALRSSADLLEAMEEMDKNGSEIACSVLRALRWRADEKARHRK